MTTRSDSETATLFISSNASIEDKTFSSDRSNSIYGNSNEITLTTKEFFHIRGYRVDQVYIPGSWYNVIDARYTIGGYDVQLDGQYSAVDVVTVLNDAGNLEFSYIQTSKKFQVKNTSGASIGFSINNSRAASLFGLDEGNYTIANGASLVSDRLSIINPYSMVEIDCSELRGTSYNVRTGHRTSIVSVPLFANPGEDIHWEAPQEASSFAVLPKQQQVQTLSFRIITQDGSLLNLNGVPFHLTLTLDTRSLEDIHTSANYQVDPMQ